MSCKWMVGRRWAITCNSLFLSLQATDATSIIQTQCGLQVSEIPTERCEDEPPVRSTTPTTSSTTTLAGTCQHSETLTLWLLKICMQNYSAVDIHDTFFVLRTVLIESRSRTTTKLSINAIAVHCTELRVLWWRVESTTDSVTSTSGVPSTTTSQSAAGLTGFLPSLPVNWTPQRFCFSIALWNNDVNIQYVAY